MREAERQTRSYLMSLFAQHGFHPRTPLGQNFLIDLNLVEFIVNSAELGRHDVVLEIGTGTGGMTSFLATQAGAVVSVELDAAMYGLARAATSGYDNVTLLNCDALHNKNRFADEVLDAVRRRLAEDPGRGLKLVANLPYSIATPVVSNLVASNLRWELMVVTIQWELAARMQAVPATPDYSALSVWLQAQCHVKILKKLGPTVFWPRPKVDSAIVRLRPDPLRGPRIADRAFFHDFVRRLFHQRRKFLRSVLAGMYRKQMSKAALDAVLSGMNFPPDARAEALDVDTLVELSNRLAATVVAGETAGARIEDQSGTEPLN